MGDRKPSDWPLYTISVTVGVVAVVGIFKYFSPFIEWMFMTVWEWTRKPMASISIRDALIMMWLFLVWKHFFREKK